MEEPAAEPGLTIDVSLLNHALMTPLAGIVLWCEMLLRKKGLPDLAEHGLVAIDRGARAQVAILDNLVELGQLRAGSTELERSDVELAKCVDDVIARGASTARLREVTIRFSRPPEALACPGDPSRLRTALYNVLDNALNASPPGGHVDVAVRTDERGVAIRISDEGGGIAPEELPGLLTLAAVPGARPRQRRGGLGLGLPIARWIAELHGGAVSVSARSPRGTCVTIELPRG